MAKYFTLFPITPYSVDANNKNALDIVTSITTRFAFEPTLKQNISLFSPYLIKDSDTPESIAYKIYGSSERHWIVLSFNNIIDPQYDWPLNYKNFTNYVNLKYAANGAANATVQTGLQWAQSENNVHSYYQINTRKPPVTLGDSKTIIEKIQIDANAYTNLVTSTSNYTLQSGEIITETVTKQKLTYYDYEMQKNEDKRSIRLLKPSYATQVFEEFKRLLER